MKRLEDEFSKEEFLDEWNDTFINVVRCVCKAVNPKYVKVLDNE